MIDVESLQREFNKVVKELGLPTPLEPSRKDGEIGKLQKEVDVFKNLIVNNIVGDIKTWAGSFDEEAFKKAKDEIPAALKKLQMEGKEKEIKSFFDSYVKVIRKFLENHIVIRADVKTMPFKEVFMVKVPKVYGTDKSLECNEKPVGFVTELPYQVERTTAYGELKDQKPLFAPIIGNFDISWKVPEPKPSGSYIGDFSLQLAMFDAMEKQTTVNSIWRYQNYGRKGEPICDKLMANEDLMLTMERIHSEVDSKSFNANASVCGLLFAIDGRTIVAVIDFNGVQKDAFEALFKLCAYVEEVPRVAPPMMAAGAGGAPGVVPGGAPGMTVGLPTWTEEELASQAQFAPSQPNMPAWTEAELESRPDKYVGGDGANLPVWTEEELAQLSKDSTSQSLNLPEWQDDGLVSCPKCGYACQASWDECPMCNAKLPAGHQKPAPKP